MTASEALSFTAVIPDTGTPLSSTGGEGEAGFIKPQHHMRATHIGQVLNLRGAVAKVTIVED